MRTSNALIMYGLLALLGLTGCPGEPAVRDAAPIDSPIAQGVVEIGTGTTAFEPLVDEDELTLWAGPQGGHHFIVHVRMKDMEPGDWSQPSLPGNPTTLFSAFDESGMQVDLELPPYALGYRERDEGDGWWYLPSGRLLRTVESLVPELDGARVRLVVRVEDAAGVFGVDERWIVAREFNPAGDAGPVDPPVDGGVAHGGLPER